MADHYDHQNSQPASDHFVNNIEEINSQQQNQKIDSVVRTPPDGDSPPPTPPPRQPPPSGKKWVRFDESTPASIVENQINETDLNGQSTTTEITKISKPSAAPRRSNLQQHQNGLMPDNEIPSTMINGNNHTATSTDIAQINVSVEEARIPGKPSSITSNVGQPQQQGYTPSHDVDESRQTRGPGESRYENGKVITEKKSENKHCAWVTIARFDPYKMPKSLISDHLTMPVEDYVTAMEMLTNDFRFRSYTVLYRRLIAGWLVASLFILIIILISGLHGLGLFGLTLFWLFLTCMGVLGCLYIKKRINKGLHNCVASVNKLLLRYNLLAGLEDRGKMSCHKIIVPFIYFDPKDCLPRIKQFLAQHEQLPGNAQTRNIPSVAVDVDPPGSYGRQATPDEKAEELILKYSQSYVRAILRRTIRFPSRPSEGVRDDVPLHCAQSLCLCQYIKKYYFERPKRKWYHRFCLDSDLPAHEERSFTTTVVAYGYPPVVYG